MLEPSTLERNRAIPREVPRDFHVISRDMVDGGSETEPHSFVWGPN